ncbi:hypothetical protein L218DRAFT_382193 [Marasmius fiardii PR-910]|nr:hypothetical protein L218DRAFT_382193 [Marasmius fiardii PR-910]
MSSAPGLNVTSVPSSTTTTPPNGDRPERSRNAKAQARHRAKRKAYIEQLEQTVTKLQTALGFTPEQVAALPPPLAKIRELEAENARLVEENERLKRLLGQDPGVVRTRSSNSLANVANGGAGYDGRCTGPTNDYGITKRRRLSGELDGMYDTGAPTSGNASPAGAPTTDMLGRAPPPPLTIPHQQHQYTHTPTHTPHSAHPAHGHGSMFSLHHHQHQQHPGAGGFTMPPSTPSSSATSSPPFSASVVPSY